MPRKLGEPLMAASDCKELAALVDLSAYLGKQKLLVQASTGNTSIKIGRTLWIKASGKWLANAADEKMFVPVDCADTDRYISGELPSSTHISGLKPSIETAMHLVIPHRVVIHVHSISAIAWAVQRNGLAFLRERMDGLKWSWIRYTPSGGALAREIQASLSCSPDVFVLANHGLVIGADSCEEAKLRLREVEERLVVSCRATSEPDLPSLEQLALSSNFQLPDAEAIHSLATDTLSTSIVSGGILYPCQAIFLGRRTPVVTTRDFLFRSTKEWQSQNGFRPPALLVKGLGVLVAEDLTRSESEMLVGLSQVARRLRSDASIAYLSDRSVDELLRDCVYGDSQLNLKRAARAASAGCGNSSKTA